MRARSQRLAAGPRCRSPLGSGAADGAASRATLGRMVEPRATSRRSIAVVGAGYVGLVSAVGFAAMGHDVELVETDPDRLAALHRGEVPFTEPGVQDALTAALAAGSLSILDRASATRAPIVLICVGTPIDDRGHADTSAVELVVGELDARDPRRSSWCAAPCRSAPASDSCARAGSSRDAGSSTILEFSAPGRRAGGFPPAGPGRHRLPREREPGRARRARRAVRPFDAPLLVVTLEESELIKNGANAYLALKISFANEIAGLAERPAPTRAPCSRGSVSIHGSAARTSTRASDSAAAASRRSSQTIAISGHERGLEMHVTSAAREANQAHQRSSPNGSPASSVASPDARSRLLGLAFKAGTDDIRCSGRALAGWLLDHDTVVHAYDPAAAAERPTRSGHSHPRHRIRCTRGRRGRRDRDGMARVPRPRLGACQIGDGSPRGDRREAAPRSAGDARSRLHL